MISSIKMSRNRLVNIIRDLKIHDGKQVRADTGSRFTICACSECLFAQSAPRPPTSTTALFVVYRRVEYVYLNNGSYELYKRSQQAMSGRNEPRQESDTLKPTLAKISDDKIPLVLTFHPLNYKVKDVISRNF